MSQLRPFQKDLFDQVNAALYELALQNPQQQPNVLAVAPTGAGKTVIMSALITAFDAPQAAIAHRQELVGQISMALAKEGVRHGIIGADTTIKTIRAAHLDDLGINYVDPRAHIRVCGIDTLVKMPLSDPWLASVKRRHDDEAHHVQKENKWGRGALMFPNAQGVGYTATAIRADGGGLGREWDGIYDRMIEGPKMRQLINMGYLTDYRLVCPTVEDLDISAIPTSKATGDYVYEQVRKAIHKSTQIVGDVVKSYLYYARGKLGVTFAVDVEAATELAAAYRAAGVPAEVVSAKTPDALRRNILRRFKRREILQLVNVDLFGEGFDLPAIEVVSMARPTKSFALYAQQFGRALRLMISDFLAANWGTFTDAQRLDHIAQSEKPVALIIDHVDNWKVHRLPDHVGRQYTLEPRASNGSKRQEDDLVPLRRCLNPAPVPPFGVLCFQTYERHLSECPHCGYVPEVGGRGSPEQVDGDIAELSPEVLAALRGEVAENLAPPKVPHGAPYAIAAGIHNRHAEKVGELKNLGLAIATWAAGQSVLTPGGLSNAEQTKLFYLAFGIDVLTAQTLGRKEAQALRERIERRLLVDNIVSAAP